MARTRSKASKRILFTWCMLAGCILLLTPQTVTGKFQFAFARIFRLPLGFSRSITLSARTSKPVTDVVSRSEYNKLRNHLANVIQQRDQALQKVETLSGFHRKYAMKNAKFIMAEVVKSSATDLIINCGKDCNLTKGQFVLADNSIVGAIADVWAQTAQVRLITSPKSKLAVRIGRLNIDTVMFGDGSGKGRIRLVPVRYKVKVGDDIFVFKAAGLLTTPMIVGKVSDCRINDANPLVWDITVTPVCNIDSVSGVAVIVLNQQN